MNKPIKEFFSEFSLSAQNLSFLACREGSGEGFYDAFGCGFQHIVFAREA
jgi:hypothetical protein